MTLNRLCICGARKTRRFPMQTRLMQSKTIIYRFFVHCKAAETFFPLVCTCSHCTSTCAVVMRQQPSTTIATDACAALQWMSLTSRRSFRTYQWYAHSSNATLLAMNLRFAMLSTKHHTCYSHGQSVFAPPTLYTARRCQVSQH